MPSTRLALALLALLVAPACAVAQTTEATLSRAEITASPASTLSGRYRLVGGQDAIRRSIDAVCDELDFVVDIGRIARDQDRVIWTVDRGLSFREPKLTGWGFHL